MALKLIGHWYDPDDARRWPHPRRLRGFRWEHSLKSQVVGYLRAGRVCVAYRGWSNCRFGCGRNGTRELTDGVFAWPEGLAHYVDVHAIRLPEEFIQHARTNRFSIPVELEDKEGHPEHDLDFWSVWCSREAPATWLDRLYYRFGASQRVT